MARVVIKITGLFFRWTRFPVLGLALFFGVQQLAFAQQQGCFAGRDYYGSPAQAFVSVERYGDWFQINGQIYSSGTGIVYQFSVDGHSGAGRMYQRHEYESGAMYMDILNLTQNEFVFEVEGYGRFYFRRAPCR